MNEKEHSPEWILSQQLIKDRKRSFITNIITHSILAIIIFALLWYIYQYDYVSYQQDGEGVNIIGDTNEVNNKYGAENEN